MRFPTENEILNQVFFFDSKSDMQLLAVILYLY